MSHRPGSTYVLPVRAARIASAAVLLALALGACGESDEEKAQNAVCDATDDIAKQVDQLASLTPATVTADAVRQNLQAIQKDFRDIGDAQPDLSEDRRRDVEAATQEFTGSVQTIVGDLGSSLSAADAKARLVTALEELKASYQEAFQPLNCD